MRRSLAWRVRRLTVGVIVGALLLAGAGTAVLVHLQALAAVDRALLAAVAVESHAPSAERWTSHHPASQVSLEWWAPGHELVDDAVAREALVDERPRWLNLAGRRVLVIAFEPVGVSQADERHPHRLLLAQAAEVRWGDVALPFLLGWTTMAGVVGVAASLTLRRLLDVAFRPLVRAVQDMEGLSAFGRADRLGGGGVTEVDALLFAVNTLLDRLDAAFAAQARFTAEAAHELRTPLTWMMGEVDLALRSGRDPTAWREALVRTRVSVEELSARVDGLMALARVDTGQVESARAPERLAQVVHAAVVQQRPALDAAGCTVDVQLTDDVVSVHTGLLAMAVGNVLSNAAAHAPGSLVQVGIEPGDDHVDVIVDDAGPGIAPADREAALDRFRKGPGSGGLGLGLPLAREIVRRHGGELTLETSPSGGCRARLRVPRGSI